jgi:uncharacterized membrane protein
MTFKDTLLISFVIIGAMTANAEAGQARSQQAINGFKSQQPCPVTGNSSGPCPGYIIDHKTALACGGEDAPSNMQWQTVAEAKAKDKWERKDCSTGELIDARYSKRSSSGSHKSKKSGRSSGSGSAAPAESAPSGQYQVGPRGGCYTFTRNGKKKYVDHSYCS